MFLFLFIFMENNMTKFYIVASSSGLGKTTVPLMLGAHRYNLDGGSFGVISNDLCHADACKFLISKTTSLASDFPVYKSMLTLTSDLNLIAQHLKLEPEGTYVFDYNVKSLRAGELRSSRNINVFKHIKNIHALLNGKCKNVIITMNVLRTPDEPRFPAKIIGFTGRMAQFIDPPTDSIAAFCEEMENRHRIVTC